MMVRNSLVQTLYAALSSMTVLQTNRQQTVDAADWDESHQHDFTIQLVLVCWLVSSTGADNVFVFLQAF